VRVSLASVRGLLRSTPLRLTVGLVVLFALVSLITLGATYFVVRDAMDKSIRSDIELELAAFEDVLTGNEVSNRVQSRSDSLDPDQRVISYITAGGRHVGNARIETASTSFQIFRLYEGDDGPDGGYLGKGQRMDGGLLVVAISREQISDLGEVFLYILYINLLPTTLIALAAGIVIARRSARRIDAVNATLRDLAEGDLHARVSRFTGRPDDISAIAEQVDRMAAAQESSVSALRQVSADIAHDLKTPIQRVSVLLSKAGGAPGLSDEIAEILTQAQAETAGIVATFQALLQIAQIEGGSPRERFAPMDIGKLTATFAEVYEPAAEESGHILQTDLAPVGTCIVHGEKVLLGQLIANLIENALRHTPSGTRIRIGVRKIAETVILTLDDTGPGIPVGERENVLRRLYRLEKSRTTPGNGLGLSLVAVIAELHEASLDLRSNDPGLGITLTFKAG